MIKLIKSTFYKESEVKEKLVRFIQDESILSMGKWCKKFEDDFAAKQGRKYAVYVANGSVANLLLIQSLMNIGVFKKGDKIGFSALTWPTNVMPLFQLGLVPVPIDCELDSLNISSNKVTPLLSEMKGIFATNVLGFCDDLQKIKEICQENDVILIEDNCESLGSSAYGRLLGNYGIASTFSFFVGHHMSTIEGGMICTDDMELYESLVMGRAHGWDRNLSEETQKKLREQSGVDDFYAKYTFYDLASNFRPTEIGGFIGTTQVPYWDEIVQKRANNYSVFTQCMKKNDDFVIFDLAHMDIVSNFAMPVICKTPVLAQKYKQRFIDAGAEVRPIIAGDMTSQPFYKKYSKIKSHLPNSEYIHKNGFYFGNNPEMTAEEIETLCSLLKGAENE